MKSTQISAMISEETRQLLERQVRATGMKKGFLLEAALRHHLRALHELPADVVIPPRILLTRESGRKVLNRLKAPGRPTAALRDLMRGD